jgi:hypothetical protein
MDLFKYCLIIKYFILLIIEQYNYDYSFYNGLVIRSSRYEFNQALA